MPRSDKPLETAVLFLVFNRPETTFQVFEAIRRAKPSRLYIAADGARDGRRGEADKVAKVREISTNIDWSCEVKTLFRENNLGCKYAVSSAITWFFEHEDEGIILEDDCLPSHSFFWFCQEMLRRYRYDESVMAVTGTNITRNIDFDGDYLFSRYALMWGWSTWASAWNKYDLELNMWPGSGQLKHLKSLGLASLSERIGWRNLLASAKAGLIDTWDYQWIYSCWLSSGVTIAPAKNLIRNIGYSDDATHSTVCDPVLSNLQLNELSWPLREPLEFKPHSKADRFIRKHWFRLTLKSLAINFSINKAKTLFLTFLGTPSLSNPWKTYFKKLS